MAQLASWMKLIGDWAHTKGWEIGPDQGTNFGELIALCHTELSEAYEEWRNGHEIGEVYTKDGKPEGVPIELADLLIRVLHICAAYDIDIEDAMQTKHLYNQGRSYRHGGKRT